MLPLTFDATETGRILLAELHWGDGLLVVIVLILVLTLLRHRRSRELSRSRARAEAARREAQYSDERLLDLIDLSSDWLWETDREHRYTEVTEGLRGHSGMDPAALIGHLPWELDWESGDTDAWKRYRERVARHDAVRILLQHTDAGGYRRHMELLGRPRYLDGQFEGYRGIGRDITAQIAAQQALLESETRYRVTFERAPVGIVSTDAEGKWVSVNDTLCAMLGYARSALIGGSLAALAEPEDVDTVFDGEATVSAAPNSFEVRLRRQGEAPIRTRITMTAVLDASEARRGLVLVVEDVTERVAAERALQESEARYRDVVESVKEVIFRADRSGRTTFLNRSWLSITGYTLEESLGRPLAAFLHPDDRIRLRDEVVRLIAGRSAECRSEFRLRTHDGEIRWLEAIARPLADLDGTVIGFAGTLDDISARKVAELTLKNINQELEARVHLRTAELEASNRELEAFSYSVSHDLRAPLRAIDGFARILEEDLEEHLDDSTRTHLQRIRSATRRMAHLIDDLIELARLTRQSLHREQVDLSELAGQIIDDLRAEDPQRVVDVEITRDQIVRADRTLLRVALENLLRNAWKFSGTRERAQISFSVQRDGERRVFCVADNGIGFDMAFANKLFRPFHRLHGSAEFPGSGIGLATVQRIVERHGGKVWAEARPDAGARFYFTLGR